MDSFDANFIHALSALLWSGDAEPLKRVTAHDEPALWLLADAHHVLLRAGRMVTEPRTPDRFLRERNRILAALSRLRGVMKAFQSEGVDAVVIKSLDHWPDFGRDIDLFTMHDPRHVSALMQSRFGAEIVPATLGDRIANKVNYRIPGLQELVEVHFGRLGQTGEHVDLARRILTRQIQGSYNGHSLPVPAPEERIILAALQRMYRHFYIRLCDIANTARIVESGVDYDDLRKVSKRAGIWPGVATYLNIVSEYVEHYRGSGLSLPYKVRRAARFGLEKVYPHAGFLRLPLFPQAASLYTRQLVRSVKRRDSAAALRLSLLPPLAAAAGAKYKVTGSDKGVW